MKKTKLTRSLMAAVSIVALSAVMYGCVHSGDDDAPATEMPTPVDTDGDGVADAMDAFPMDPDETADADGDGVGDNADAFPMDATETADSDMDGVGNNADPDDDNDGVADADDALPNNGMESADADGDGIGDNADIDDDNDGVADAHDVFPNDAAEWADSDGDGYGDNMADAFPDDATEWADSDGDGVGDNADTDRDNDGVADADDAFPDDPMETADLDMDGTGDNADTDRDGDGVADADDAFPDDPMETVDSDMDGVGDSADDDRDGDGVADADDAFPDDPMETADLDMDGTGDNADTDRDGDGVANVADRFPNDPAETQDSDEDGVGNNADAFPFDGTETVDADGDGVGDNADAFDDDPMETADSDMDGVGDNADAFDDDPMETADADGDGVGDNADAFDDDATEWADSDGDGVGDNADAFPMDDDETADADMDGVGDNADPFSDGEPSLFLAANGAHVVDLESTMNVNEKAVHVTSVGAAMAAIATAASGNQAASTTGTATYPGDTVDNPATADADESAEGMFSFTVNVAGTTSITSELRASKEATDDNNDGDMTDAGEPSRIQTARMIGDLGTFQGYDLWEDDGDATTDTDRARAIVFTNKQQGDDSKLTRAGSAARSVKGQTVSTSELSTVTSTGNTIAGVTWTPSGEAPLTGTLECTGDACTITLGEDGAVATITGYTFTGSRAAVEAVTAADAAEDNDYLIFGLWLEESDDGATDTFGAFASGGTGYAVNVQEAVTGTAEYSGKAAGAHHKTGEGVNWFEGNASLRANFGASTDTGQDAAGYISGSISGIRVNGGAAMSTPIYLGQANLTDATATFNGAAFMGAATAPGASTHEFDGTWSGSFFGDTEDDDGTTDVDESVTAPLAAAGTFGVTKSEGTGNNMVVESFVGAFGAHLDD